MNIQFSSSRSAKVQLGCSLDRDITIRVELRDPEPSFLKPSDTSEFVSWLCGGTFGHWLICGPDPRNRSEACVRVGAHLI
mgnify:CR=1 FL=1